MNAPSTGETSVTAGNATNVGATRREKYGIRRRCLKPATPPRRITSRRPANAIRSIDPWLDREMQSAFAALHGADGAIPSRPIYDASEGTQWPWRRMGQRLREARAGRTKKQNAMRVVRVLEAYVERLYADLPEAT